LVKYVVSVFKKGEPPILSSWECWSDEMDKARENARIMAKELKTNLVIQFMPAIFFEDIPYDGKETENIEK